MSTPSAPSAEVRRRILRLPARSLEIGELFDTYIACAVATIVLLRIYLEVTGYPKLGGNGLHIAHVLWGGLAMTIAIGILTGFVSRRARQLGAIVGGIGFGLFIDELGKFLTSDNNYFFRPAAMIIYAVFVVLVLLGRLVRGAWQFTEQEKLASVLELLKEAAIGDLDRQEHAQARLLLQDIARDAPWSPALHSLVRDVHARDLEPSVIGRMVGWVREKTTAALDTRWLLWLLASIYMLQAVVTFLVVLVLVVVAVVLSHAPSSAGPIGDIARAGIAAWLPLAAALLSSVGAIAGAISLWRNRRLGLLILEVSVLADLFLVQPFALLESQFAALGGVFVDLALLVVIRHLSRRARIVAHERELTELESTGPTRVSGVAATSESREAT